MRKRSSPTPWVVAGAVSLLAWLLLVQVAPGTVIPWTPTMMDAARRMERGLAATRAYCDEAGILVPRSSDPNGTGLIGPDYSELFTTLDNSRPSGLRRIPTWPASWCTSSGGRGSGRATRWPWRRPGRFQLSCWPP